MTAITSPLHDRFALGTYDAAGPAVLDTDSGDIFSFGSWEAAQSGVEMLRAGAPVDYFSPTPNSRTRFFMECEPGVEEARA
jgi:hypothetical protein